MMYEMKLPDERKSGLREGIEECLKEGKREGKREGMKEGKREIAVKLLRQNHHISFIVDITGLSNEEVLELKQNLDSSN